MRDVIVRHKCFTPSEAITTRKPRSAKGGEFASFVKVGAKSRETCTKRKVGRGETLRALKKCDPRRRVPIDRCKPSGSGGAIAAGARSDGHEHEGDCNWKCRAGQCH